MRPRVPPAGRVGAERAHHGADDERLAHARPTRPSGVGPVATSRPRVWDQALHEPGYTDDVDARERPRKGGVRGGDARSAVRGDRGSRHDSGCRERGPDRRRVAESSGLEVGRGRQVDRAGNVPGHRIERFHVSAIPLGCPHVQQHSVLRPGCGIVDRRDAVGQVGQDDISPARLYIARLERMSLGHPCPQPSVEHAHVEHPAAIEQPPRPGRRHGLDVVVGHDGLAGPKPPSPRGFLQRVPRGQRMPALGGLALPGELVIEVDVHSARQVALQVLRAALGPVQAPAHVEHADGVTGGQESGEFRRGDQERHGPMVPPTTGTTASARATVRPPLQQFDT